MQTLQELGHFIPVSSRMTCNSVISACDKGSRWSQAFWFLGWLNHPLASSQGCKCSKDIKGHGNNNDEPNTQRESETSFSKSGLQRVSHHRKIIQNHHTARSSMICPADDLHRQSHRHDVVLLTCGLGACASSAQWHQSLALALASTSTSASTDILQSLAVTACVQLLGFLGWMLGSLRQIFIVL